MNTQSTDSPDTVGDLASGRWHLDPARSSVEFHVPHFYGLMTVKGTSTAITAAWTYRLTRQPTW